MHVDDQKLEVFVEPPEPGRRRPLPGPPPPPQKPERRRRPGANRRRSRPRWARRPGLRIWMTDATPVWGPLLSKNFRKLTLGCIDTSDKLHFRGSLLKKRMREKT